MPYVQTVWGAINQRRRTKTGFQAFRSYPILKRCLATVVSGQYHTGGFLSKVN